MSFPHPESKTREQAQPRAVLPAGCVLLAACFLFGAACTETDRPARSGAELSHSARTDCAERRILMGVAASLQPIAKELAQELATASSPIQIELSAGASSALARQLELGAPFDLIVSADESIVEGLVERGAVKAESVQAIARGTLVLAAHAKSALRGDGPEVFDEEALHRFALPGAAVPLGRYGEAWLHGIGRLEALGGLRVATENARASAAALEQGHVDLALLYESDFRISQNVRAVHRPHPRDYPPIRYVAAEATRSSGCPEVTRTLAAWTSPLRVAQFLAAGFEGPQKP